MKSTTSNQTIAIIGGGPAGLMAAERLSALGYGVSIYERKPSVGRKFLMAGRGGLNITHSEKLESFLDKYSHRKNQIAPMIRAFSPQNMRDWCAGLGQDTFIGSSGRVFPSAFKASPLMRAWIARLRAQNVEIYTGYNWCGWDQDALLFETETGVERITAAATILALGGASWPKLGSNGDWVDILRKKGVDIADFSPSNCGFHVDWSDIFKEKQAGQPLKSIKAFCHALDTDDTAIKDAHGEIMITENGIEGGAIYALSAALRDMIAQYGKATLYLDLKPDLNHDALVQRLQKPRGRQSFSPYLRKTLNLSPTALALILEHPDRAQMGSYSADKLAALIKAYPLTLKAPFSIERAISSAGGVRFEDLDDGLMLRSLNGVFVAGEMLDWEAPTGGYLLQATMASGVYAARAVHDYLVRRNE